MTRTAPFPTLVQIPSVPEFKALDGSSGKNRAPHELCQIRANNDWEAMQSWLQGISVSSTRLYQKEAERLLLWCIYKVGKPLSSLDSDDLYQYLDFLSNPQPRDVWCGAQGGRGRKRGDKYWKPFAGPLSLGSKLTTIGVLKSLFKFLTAARYLAFNPFTIMPKANAKLITHEERKIELSARILEVEEWNAMVEVLEEWPAATKHKEDDRARLKFMVYTLFLLGLRISELADSTWSSFRKIEGKWWLVVRGKGGKVGKVPVNDELLREIRAYRAHLKCPSLEPTPEDTRPLVMSWNSGEPLTTRQMNKMLKALALKTVEKFPHEPERQEKLKRFSAHWLRHFSATMQDRVGMSFTNIKENHRHQSGNTTRLYIHAHDANRHEDMQKLKIKVAVNDEQG